MRSFAHRSPIPSAVKDYNSDLSTKDEFTIRPEALRFYAYIFFWTMCIFAMVLTKYVVSPRLLAGPANGETCPPFETGEGFDINTDSHLMRVFGFNNICVNWDYSPSREIIAMYFPLFEYTLLAYIVADYINVKLHWKKGLVSTRFYTVFRILLPLMVMGCALFRLIFVMIAYVNVGGHTLGFLLMQVTLVLVACLNVWFVVESKTEYSLFRGYTKELAFVYFGFNLAISAVKIFLTAYTVLTSSYPDWASTPVAGDIVAGQIVDWVWMVFNALIPMVLSFVRMRADSPLEISVDVSPLSCVLDGGAEDMKASEEDSGGTMASQTGTHSARNALPLHQVAGQGWQVTKAALVKGKVNRPPLDGTHTDYPFENVVFQGGGAKGIAYTGAITAMDELGILPYLKRFAAASAGSFPALLLSLGLDGKQVKKEVDELEMAEFFDANILSYGYNLVTKSGMHPAKKCIQNIEAILEKYTGDKDLTFLGLYQRYGTELCISGSNISRHQSEYFHVNTSPDMPIKIAIRITMSVPILWAPVDVGGNKYVDGGVFNNFPLKVTFDGWFLSTRKEDGVLAKMVESSPRILDDGAELFEYMGAASKCMSKSFAEPNMKTIGFRVSYDMAGDNGRYASYLSQLEGKLRRSTLRGSSSRHSFFSLENEESGDPQAVVEYPPTKLAQAYKKKNKDANVNVLSVPASDYDNAYIEMSRWMILSMAEKTASDLHPHALMSTVLMRELQRNPPREPLTPELFGYTCWPEVVASMDRSGKGYVTRTDLGEFWGRFGVRHAFMKNRKPRTINSVQTLMFELMDAMFTVFEENLMRDKSNALRTCSLNSHYVDFLDLELEQADKDFLGKTGKETALKWIVRRAEEVKADRAEQRAEKVIGLWKSLPSRISSASLAGKSKAKRTSVSSVPSRISWIDRDGEEKVEEVDEDSGSMDAEKQARNYEDPPGGNEGV